MVAFRKWFPVLAFAGLVLGFADRSSAQTLPLSCQATAGVPPIVRAEGYTELVGDIVLNCTGGTAGQVFLTNIQVFLNTNITSRIVGSSNLSEALLLVDEPGSPTNPTQTVCTPPAIAVGTAACNIFRGTKAQGENSIVWAGIPFTAPGTNRVIRLTNIRANAAGLGVSSTLIPTQIVAFVSASGSQALPINNPQQSVGFIQQGLLFDVRTCTGGSIDTENRFFQCSTQNTDLAGGTLTGSSDTSQFSVRFREGFQTAFKPQVATSGTPPVNAQVPSIPGQVYNSESGFLLSSSDLTGFANSGTRVAARFNNVPASIRIFVSVTNGAGSTSGSSAVLVSTDINGGSGGGTGNTIASTTTFDLCGSTAVAIPAAEVSVVAGTGLAVWEVVSSNPSISETLVFQVAIAFRANTASNLPGLGTSTVTGSFAPFYATSATPNPAIQSSSLPVPRFIDTPVSSTAFTINTCQTNLLFPFVTNTAGFDTGIAISNTSRDPFGTASQQTGRQQAGTCTLYYFGGTTGGGAAPAAQTTTSTVAAGAQLLFVLSTGGTNGIAATPGFTGYIIAQCAFQYAHGFAFITDGPIGQARVAEGYLALVMDSGIGTRTGASSEVLSH